MRWVSVSLDGGEPVRFANDVKIVFHDDDSEPDEPARELHVTVTHEGVIMDAIEDGEVEGTRSEDVDQILDALL